MGKLIDLILFFSQLFERNHDPFIDQRRRLMRNWVISLCSLVIGMLLMLATSPVGGGGQYDPVINGALGVISWFPVGLTVFSVIALIWATYALFRFEMDE